MPSITQLFGRLLLVCAMIVVPPSMAHGSMGLNAVRYVENHAMLHDAFADMARGHVHRSGIEVNSHSSNP